MTDDEIDGIIAKLTATEREVATALLGNAWEGHGKPSPGIMLMNSLELMHVDALKNFDSSYRRYKARPTSLGHRVRARLSGSDMSNG